MKLFQQFKFPKLKMRKRRKKLRATAGRRSVRATTADYEEMSEPNMKLSRALLIVLLLHVVAVSGIIAFNAIKTRQASIAATPSYTGIAPKAFGVGSTNTIAASPSPAASIKRAQPVGNATDKSHKTYVVARGDNPVTIARKLKVSYDELIALNHIDDPRKLRIGQKLLIPKSTKGKKDE
jgi:LysM repeat protein